MSSSGAHPHHPPGGLRRGSSKRRMSVPMVERSRRLHEKDIDTSLAATTLQHTHSKPLDKKDFASEVRGHRDIMVFFEKSEVGTTVIKLVSILSL